MRLDIPAIVSRIHERIIQTGNANDATGESLSLLPAPVDMVTLNSAEVELGFPLPLLYRECLTSIANGGFGPGYGLIGVNGGRADSFGNLLVEGYRSMPSFMIDGQSKKVEGLLPAWEWGAGITICMNAKEPMVRLFVVDESGLTKSPLTLLDALEQWAEGKSLWDLMFESRELTRPNPFQGGLMKIKAKTRAVGEHVAEFGTQRP